MVQNQIRWFRGMLMEELMIHFTALSQNLTSRAEEDHERLMQGSQCVPVKFWTELHSKMKQALLHSLLLTSILSSLPIPWFHSKPVFWTDKFRCCISNSCHCSSTKKKLQQCDNRTTTKSDQLSKVYKYKYCQENGIKLCILRTLLIP